ncbi:peptidoglycan DD-metalloendopeptidase family protein [Pseudonocardia nematodicida]|uniref:Peptidoglycan DD-metalloendopeptidase family protein n=1 Tax=Pseudonocardia nematodicida TaxID=1206997 RepID=A0ABV1KJ20_9PSEU
MAGVGGYASPFPAGPHVRRSRTGDHRTDDGSGFSATTRVAAAVVAVGGLAGAAQATVGSVDLPLPTAWPATSSVAAAAELPATVPAPRTPADALPASTPIADPATIAALATPAAGGGSVAAQAVIAPAGVHASAAEAAGSASASVQAVQEAAAERARAAEAAAAAAAAAPAASAPAAAAAPVGGGISIVSGRVTSGFGARWGAQHNGLDIAAPIGTPINVPIAGTVIDSGPASGFGMWVRVQHDDGTITVYGHINRSLVSVGERVQAGQQIAEVGNRGQSTGPHLHIEVIQGGTKINPKPWLDANGFSYT